MNSNNSCARARSLRASMEAAVVRKLESVFRGRCNTRSRVLVVNVAVRKPRSRRWFRKGYREQRGRECADGKTRPARAGSGEQSQQKATAGVGRSGPGSTNLALYHLHLHDDADMA